MADAVALNVLETGADHPGRPVVVLHGLFGNARNWSATAKALPRRVLAADMRNHGASPWDGAMTYPAMAEDVGRLLTDHGAAPADLIGHSMGGKAAMVLALTRPELIDRLIVVDIAPIPYSIRFQDYLAAMEDLDLSTLKRRAEADAALAPVIEDAGERAFLVQNLVSAEGGGFRWRINIDAIAENLPAICGFPKLPPLARFDGPVLFVAGETSPYIDQAARPRIQARFPNARIVTIKNAGHWVHAEAPDAFLACISPFLDADFN